MDASEISKTFVQDGFLRPVMDALQGIGAAVTEIADGLGYFGDVISIVFGVFAFLGVGGTALFFLSLILLGFLGAFSPLSKTTNYLIVVIGVTVMIVLDMGDLSQTGETMSLLSSYLTVMVVPLVAVYAFRAVLGRLGGRSETQQLREAVTELTEQVAALRRDRQGENAEDDRGGIRGRYEALGEPMVAMADKDPAEAGSAQPAAELADKPRPMNLRLVRRR